MSRLSRRQLLIFFGASAATTALGPTLTSKIVGGEQASVAEAAMNSYMRYTPIRLPHPLPIYQTADSFLPTGIDAGELISASSNTQLSSYTVIDDVAVPPEYERYVIVAWGDRVYPNSDEYFGYNNDFTGFVPINGEDDGYLWVNHEYVSYPLSEFAPGAPSDLVGLPTSFPQVIGYALPDPAEDAIGFLGELSYNVGGSVIRIRKDESGRFEVNRDDRNNRRIHLLSGLSLNESRDFPSSWGARSYQQGDDNYLIGTGPAVSDVFSRSEDGLGERIIGTGFNCSGGVTPWGTILSAEENFQGGATFFVGVQEQVRPDGAQLSYIDGTVGAAFGLVGEKYGWMVEIDPADPTVRNKKHTALGRFRHENITFRARTGEPLIAYMGDDRRGGHTWKYVSAGRLGDLNDKHNSDLFEEGVLYAAKYFPDGTGEWIPLELSTPTNPNRPSELASVELQALGEAQNNGGTRLPQRAGVGGATEDGGFLVVDITNEDAILPDYEGGALSDFYPNQGAVLVDAFLAANLVGATPSSRPEDLEVDPRTNVVYIAYTDHIPGGDGYPDSRVFQTAKLSAAVDAQQPSGGLYKIIEDSSNGAGTTFRWEKFVEAGAAGAVNGDGFANVDNLAFDPKGNIFGVTDMSTSRQNGFRTGANPGIRTIDHTETGGTDALVGVFGNNWAFFVPISGPNAGELCPLAYGPPRCEMTGPTFIGDTLIVGVQHPGEDVPIGAEDQAPLNQDIEMLDLDGALFMQNRTVPLGSNWPSNIGYPLPTVEDDGAGDEGDPNGPPRPAVIGIRFSGGSSPDDEGEG